MKLLLPVVVLFAICGCGEKNSLPKEEPRPAPVVVEQPRPLPDPKHVGVPEKEKPRSDDDPLAIVPSQVIGNVRATITIAQLQPMPKDITERQGEPCWCLMVTFRPVNGRTKYEFWPWIFQDAGRPELTYKGTRLACLLKTTKANPDDKKWVASSEKSTDCPIYFEATPDPVDHLDVSIPTQLDGHESESFRFRLPAKVLDRTKWDGRGK